MFTNGGGSNLNIVSAPCKHVRPKADKCITCRELMPLSAATKSIRGTLEFYIDNFIEISKTDNQQFFLPEMGFWGIDFISFVLLYRR